MRNHSIIQFFPAAFLRTVLWMVTVLGSSYGEEPSSSGPVERLGRQPVALVCAEGGKTVFVANRRSGSLTVIDAATRKVVAESQVGRGLAHLATLPDGHQLLAVDQASNEILLINHQDRSIQVIDRFKVSPDPVHLVISTDGSVCVLASRWSRQLTFIALGKKGPDGKPGLSSLGTVALPFCPLELANIVDGTKLVVADAFGGRLAVVDTQRRSIDSVRSLPAHNIRGMAFAPDGQTLVLAHQVLNRLAHASFDDVHWGQLIRNHLRVLRTDALLKPGSDAVLLDGGRLFDLGDTGYAAGDPAGLAFDVRGNLILALAGVDEVAVTLSPDQAPRRITVGRRPTAVAPSPDGKVVYVADTLDDTISVVDIGSGQRLATISLGPQSEPSSVDRGERLFHSAKLSHDGWMSCHSCHTDGHTNNLLSDTLGDESYGAAKRVPSLLGVAATGPWTWTGSIARLEDQVKKSIATTMYGAKPSDQQVADLTAYLSSLAPLPSLFAGENGVDSAAAVRGRAVFETRKCETCHAPPEYTSPQRYDVGLVDEVGNHEFNPPSLRGVSQRDSLLHDGRARSLVEVFQKERHPRGLVLTTKEIDDLVKFLRTL